MKNLKTTTLFTLIITVLFAFTACKKDSGNGPNGGSSYYQFNDVKYNIASASERHIDGDIFLELTAESAGNYLQIDFANVDALPVGVLTYHADRNVGYDPMSNFWSTAIGFEGNPVQVSGGTITISKDGANYKIVFDIDTANGKITGEYNGIPEAN